MKYSIIYKTVGIVQVILALSTFLFPFDFLNLNWVWSPTDFHFVGLTFIIFLFSGGILFYQKKKAGWFLVTISAVFFFFQTLFLAYLEWVELSYPSENILPWLPFRFWGFWYYFITESITILLIFFYLRKETQIVFRINKYEALITIGTIIILTNLYSRVYII